MRVGSGVEVFREKGVLDFHFGGRVEGGETEGNLGLEIHRSDAFFWGGGKVFSTLERIKGSLSFLDCMLSHPCFEVLNT